MNSYYSYTCEAENNNLCTTHVQGYNVMQIMTENIWIDHLSTWTVVV